MLFCQRLKGREAEFGCWQTREYGRCRRLLLLLYLGKYGPRTM
jgi:hypothetical protein